MTGNHSHSSTAASSFSSHNVVGVHYRVGKKIGEGSFGIIYEGELGEPFVAQAPALRFPNLRSNANSFASIVIVKEPICSIINPWPSSSSLEKVTHPSSAMNIERTR